MAEVTAAKVKELREKTGAGMMDAKKALVENDSDMEQAVDWLRTKGLAKAAKKSGRAAAEGLVAVATSDKKGAVVEINSETDFVSRNDKFQDFVAKVAEIALNAKDAEALGAAEFEGDKSVSESLTELIATIGENMSLRRSALLEVSEGAVIPYVHAALVPGMGKIGVLVALESGASADVLEGLGKQLAMHIAAANPASLDQASLDPAAIERERTVLKEQAIESGKPADIAEKMVEGRMRKYFEEVCLLEQTSMIDGETKIADLIANTAKEAGAEIKLTQFARFQLGEGVEKEETDFAAEVAAAANG